METIIRAATLAPEPLRLANGRPRAAVNSLETDLPGIDPVRPPPMAAKEGASETSLATAAMDRSPPAPLTVEELKTLYQDELQNLRAEAERLGYGAGLEQAEALAAKVIKEHTQRLVSIVAQLEQAKQAVLMQGQHAALEIAFAAVCKLIGETAFSRDTLLGCINQALAGYRERHALAIRLHPQDVQLIQHSAGSVLPADFPTLIADPAIQYGGCLVETPTGGIDARFDVQLEELRQTLLEARRASALPGQEGT